jgi:hypothetical protein
MRNIRDMIHAAQQMQSDTIHQRDMRPLERPVLTEQTLTNYDLIPGDSARPRAIMPNNKPHR